jgi:hypothetical protein
MEERVEGTIRLRGEPDALFVDIEAGEASLSLPVEALAPAFAHPVAFTHVVEALLNELEEHQETIPPGVLDAVAGILDAASTRARALAEAHQS